MGPIRDTQGIEQGGVKSSEEFQLVENDELSTVQSSNLGLNIGPVCISSIGAADDAAFLSNSIHGLQSLLNLSTNISKQHLMKIVDDKTKLLVFKIRNDKSCSYWLSTHPLILNNNEVPPSPEVEHVGVKRSADLSN